MEVLTPHETPEVWPFVLGKGERRDPLRLAVAPGWLEAQCTRPHSHRNSQPASRIGAPEVLLHYGGFLLRTLWSPVFLYRPGRRLGNQQTICNRCLAPGSGQQWLAEEVHPLTSSILYRPGYPAVASHQTCLESMKLFHP